MFMMFNIYICLIVKMMCGWKKYSQNCKSKTFLPNAVSHVDPIILNLEIYFQNKNEKISVTEMPKNHQ